MFNLNILFYVIIQDERVREHRKEILEVAQTKMPLQKAVGPMVERFIH